MAIAGNFDQTLRGSPYLVGWGAVLREGGAGFFRSHLSSQKRLPIFRLHTRISLKKIPVWHGSSRSSLRIRSWSCAKRAFSSPPSCWEPHWNRNNITQQFHHLQQHGFENPKYRVYFCKSYPSKEKDSQGYPGLWESRYSLTRFKDYFAEKLTMSGSLKNHFTCQVK